MPLLEPEKIPDGHHQVALAPFGLDGFTPDEVIAYLANNLHAMEARVHELEKILVEREPSLVERIVSFFKPKADEPAAASDDQGAQETAAAEQPAENAAP